MRVSFAHRLERIAAGVQILGRTVVRHEDVWVVRVEVERFECAPLCARCLSPATGNRLEDSPSGAKTINVPYCQDCLDSFGKQSVARLAWILASVLLGVAGCVFFPLLPWLSRAAAVSGAVFFAAVPWILGQLWLRRADSPLPLRSAAYASGEGVVCSNAEWAQILGERLGATVEHRQLRTGVALGWSTAGLVITVIVTPGLYDTFHCEARILNLTEEELVVTVDHHLLAVTRPTTREHPRAGSIVRIAMGSRHIEARRHDGTLVHEDLVQISAGQTYLYVPLHPPETCFWLERTALGRERTVVTEREALPASKDFWQMPVAIDTWFTPALGPESNFFTGGVVTSLRQGPCEKSSVPNADR
jgi:hypothetical protein